MNSETKLLTIVICTVGRTDLINDAIESMAEQPLSHDLYEILLVDDSSDESTRKIFEKYQQRYSHIRYTKNKGKGLLRARYTGQREALGEYICYYDDDARANPEWLVTAERVIRERKPVCFGGPFYPFYITKKPAWYRDAYGSNHLGDKARNLEVGEIFAGNNVVFEAKTLRESGGFDPDFCKPTDKWTYGDEDLPQHRLRQKYPNREFYFDPKLYVKHLVRPVRLSLLRAARECFAIGRAYVKVYGVPESEQRAFPFIRRLIQNYGIFILKSIFVSPFRSRDKYEFYQNYIVEDAFRNLKLAGIFFQTAKVILNRCAQVAK